MRAFLAALLLCLFAAAVAARDGGQWPQADPAIADWFATLMQPDNPYVPCCGYGDAYWADKVEAGPNNQLIAVVTDDRPDEALGREHVPSGTRYVVPAAKIKWDRGNPTGHIVVFLSYGIGAATRQVICYVQNGGV